MSLQNKLNIKVSFHNFMKTRKIGEFKGLYLV